MFQNDVVSMVEIARANHIRVILASLLPASRFPWQPEARPAAEIREWNAWLKQYAERQRMIYLDYYSALVDEEGGMKPSVAIALAFKRETDPRGLLNPGKMIAWENPEFDFSAGKNFLFPGLEARARAAQS